MDMKKFLLYCALSCTCLSTWAQIHISPYMVPTHENGMNGQTAELVSNSLRELLSQAGALSRFGNSRFVMTAKCVSTGKEVLGNAPTRIISRYNASFSIGDGVSGTCYATQNMELTGVGKTDEQAAINAMRTIAKQSDKLKQLIRNAEQRIMDYYNRNSASIFAKAKSLIAGSDYEQAIYELSLIPQEADAYGQAQLLLQDAYRRYVNHNAAQLLQQAQAEWAANPSKENAHNVAALLFEIDASATCRPQVEKFLLKVEQQSKVDLQREHDLKVAEMEHNAELRKAYFKAMENIAAAYANSRPSVIHYHPNVGLW